MTGVLLLSLQKLTCTDGQFLNPVAIIQEGKQEVPGSAGFAYLLVRMLSPPPARETDILGVCHRRLYTNHHGGQERALVVQFLLFLSGDFARQLCPQTCYLYGNICRLLWCVPYNADKLTTSSPLLFINFQTPLYIACRVRAALENHPLGRRRPAQFPW